MHSFAQICTTMQENAQKGSPDIRAALGDRGSRYHNAPQCRLASKFRQTRRRGKRPGYSSARSRILFTTISIS